MTAEDVALGYKNLLQAERSFRDMKSTPRVTGTPTAVLAGKAGAGTRRHSKT